MAKKKTTKSKKSSCRCQVCKCPVPCKCINEKMTFEEAIQKLPQEAGLVFAKYGLHCLGCVMAGGETIEQGCLAHGLTKEQIKKMIGELNKLAKDL